MQKISAGILMFNRHSQQLRVLLAHPGGPYFAKKDDGNWTIPKGGVNPGEDLLAAAQREFEEETGFKPAGEFLPLKPIKLKSGKIVHAWAIEGDVDTTRIKSNNHTMEWPPRSGKHAEFPEIDRAAFFDVQTAKIKLNPAQAALVDQLVILLQSKLG